MDAWAAQGDAHLYIHSWNVENCCLHVVGLGLQRGRAFLASEQMGGGGAGGLQLLLLGRRLLVETPEAALTAPVEPQRRAMLSQSGLKALSSLRNLMSKV